jgi:hypothetical protein
LPVLIAILSASLTFAQEEALFAYPVVDRCGVKSSSLAKLRQHVASGRIKRVHKGMLGAVSVPAEFDAATNWPQCAVTINDIRDQSNCGCCWAFAAAEAATDRMCIATNGSLTMPLSAQDVCFCGSDSGCDGGMLPDAWDFIQESGVVTGAQQLGALRNDDPFSDGGMSDTDFCPLTAIAGYGVSCQRVK